MLPKNYWFEKWKQMMCFKRQAKLEKLNIHPRNDSLCQCDICEYNYDSNLIYGEEAVDFER